MAATLAEHVRAQQWEAVAFYLLIGLVRALEEIPLDALPDLLDLLIGEPHESR